ncbi:MAG: metallophosphoesterase family protein, partial [Lachnospiraceae bacterium]
MNLKRIELKALSILMALAMIIGMCPSLGLSVHAEGSSGTVLAASGGEQGNLGEGKTVLAFTSDIHNTSNNTAANRLDTWLDNEMSVYGHIDGMCFCGDMGGAQANESEFWSFTQSVMSVVEDNDIPGVYTTGNHEFYNGKYSTTSNTTVKDRYIVGAEGLNGSNYRIYCLGTDNWNNSSDNYTTSQVDTLNSYLESAGTDKPIIILTHFPLHRAGSSGSSGWGGYTRQTTNADLVIDALNAGAARGQTIVLLWGHNHTLSDAFYDQIYYPGYNLQYSSSSSKTIQFYYGAAGCMSDSEYGTGSAYVKGKGLIITIDEDDNDLDFHYYNASGTDVTEDSEGNPGGGDDPGSDTPSSTTYQFNEVSELTAGKDYVVAVADASGEKVIAINNNGSNNDVTGVS